MKEIRLAAMALLVVIVAPLILGWAWPSGTETVDTWTTENSIDITPSIATNEIPIIDSYSGPMNYYWLYDGLGYSSYEPVSYSSSPSAIPRLSYTATVESITSNPWPINLDHFTGYRTDFITAINITVIMRDHTIYSCSTIAYMPGANSLYLIGMGYTGQAIKASDIQSISVQGATPSAPVLLTIREYALTGEYVNMSDGFTLDSSLAPQGLQWFNGMDNHSVEIWIRTASIQGPSSVTGGGVTVSLSLNSGNIIVNGQTLGGVTAYPYISLLFNHDTGTVTANGLIGADNFTDPTWSLGNSIKITGPVALMDNLTMKGQFEYEIKRTYSEIGTGRGIQDAAIIPYSFYPHSSWQISLTQPARFGESVTIGGTTYPVVNGSITITEIEGEEHTITIRDMAILSLTYYDGPNGEAMQHIYINGLEIQRLAPSGDYSIVLNGDWYVTATVYDVSQGEQTKYIWEAGVFGLDKTGICMAGLISSIAIMIGAGLWGRASGTKLMILMVTMACAAAVYLIMMG